MSDDTNNNAPQDPVLHAFLRRAAALEEYAYEDTTRLLTDVHQFGMPKGAKTLIIYECARSTKLDITVVRGLSMDVERHHPEHGVLSSLAEITAALEQDLTARFGTLMYTDGSLYAYQADQTSDEYGMFLRQTSAAVDDFMRQNYPEVLIRQASVRREIQDRLNMRVQRADGFVNAPAAFCVMNGVLLWDPSSNAVNLVPHSAAHLCRNKLAAFYDPEAKAEKFWQKLLRAFGGDQTKAIIFIEFLACAIFGARPANDRNRTGMILVGAQRTGKSTLINLVRMLFSEELLASVSPDMFSKTDYLVQLAGCALNTVTELQTRKLLKGHTIKQVRSGEPVMARRLYENNFTFVPRCMNLWACNELPRLDESHPSMARRFIVLSMGETLTDAEAADDFADVLEEEQDGIVAVIVESFLAAMRRGHFVLPNDNDALVARMQFGNDVAPQFVRLHIVAHPSGRVTSEELQRELRVFVTARGLDPDEVVHNGLLKQIVGLMREQFGAVRRKLNGQPFYEGVGFQGIASRSVPGNDQPSTLEML